MTDDTSRPTQVPRKTWYWIGGVGVAVIAILIALWLAGVFNAATPVQ